MKSETYISLSVLLILTGIAAGVFLTQFHFNPAILSVETLTSAGGSLSEPRTVQPLTVVPENGIALNHPEVFDAANLSDKIDGKAELYLSAGFLKLQCQRLKKDIAAESWAEIFVYDMGNSDNAFSVFSSQRRKDAEPLDIAEFSYRTKNAVFLAHGNYYLEIISSAASEDNFDFMNSVLKNFILGYPVKPVSSLRESDLFPESGQIQNSLALLSADVFGYQELNRVFTVLYRIGGTELRAFLSRRETSEEAERLASGFHAFLLEFGAEDRPLTKEIGNAKLAEIMESYEIVFSLGPFLAGIHEAENKDAAEKLADRLYHRIAAIADKKRENEMQKATFGAGCFWGIEAAFRKIKGVLSTSVGYMGGLYENPTYRDVCTDKTGHAEVVEVIFDPSLVSYDELLARFWEIHDPTSLNRQGPDIGTQYRSVIFYHNAEQESAARASKESLLKSGRYKRNIVTEITAASVFYRAEEYHQQYFEKQGVIR